MCRKLSRFHILFAPPPHCPGCHPVECTLFAFGFYAYFYYQFRFDFALHRAPQSRRGRRRQTRYIFSFKNGISWRSFESNWSVSVPRYLGIFESYWRSPRRPIHPTHRIPVNLKFLSAKLNNATQHSLKTGVALACFGKLNWITGLHVCT